MRKVGHITVQTPDGRTWKAFMETHKLARALADHLHMSSPNLVIETELVPDYKFFSTAIGAAQAFKLWKESTKNAKGPLDDN